MFFDLFDDGINPDVIHFVSKQLNLFLQGFALFIELSLIGVKNFYLLEMRVCRLQSNFDRGSWVAHVVDHHVQEELGLL